MSQPDETRLNDLKQRWAQDPGSRLYLQLADEHRKLGQLVEAEAVLSEGLEKRPGDLSGLVALGRARLDLAKLDEALEALQSVVTRDPVHLVANKLLLETHLQRGEADKAGERLEICRLLNDRDPEIEALKERLGRLRAVPPEPEAAPVTEPMVAPSTPEEPGSEAASIPADDAPAVNTTVQAGEEPFAFLMEQIKAPAQQAASPPAFEREAERVSESEPVGEPSVESEPVASAKPVTEPVEDSFMPSPSTPPSSGDEIFALGDEGAPEAPSLESLWVEHSTPKRRTDPFAGLGAYLDLAPGEIFSIAPPPPATMPAPDEDVSVLEKEVTAVELDAPTEASSPDENSSFDGTSPGDPVVYEELADAAGSDLMLDTQRTPFTVDEAGGLEVESEPAVPEPAVPEPAAETVFATPGFYEDHATHEQELVPDTSAHDTTAETLFDEAPAGGETVTSDSAVEALVEAAEAESTMTEETSEKESLPPLALSESPAAPEDAELVADELFEETPPIAAAEDITAEILVSESSAPEVATPREVEEEVETVALGSLYLRQGHVEEAAGIFNKILERDPGNQAAQAGLQLTRESLEETPSHEPWEEQQLTAEELMAESALSGTIPAGTTAKKLLLLGNYLNHMRTARDRQYVR